MGAKERNIQDRLDIYKYSKEEINKSHLDKKDKKKYLKLLKKQYNNTELSNMQFAQKTQDINQSVQNSVLIVESYDTYNKYSHGNGLPQLSEQDMLYVQEITSENL
ncbi:MAG: hypothetical protein GXP45_02600 [bacterium]|nr:hypothetical protein [bacterium]